MLTIKSDQRGDYPDLLSISQLKRIGLMPAAGSKPDVIVNRQIYGNYFLYDKTKCIPYVSSEEEKEKRRISARKRKTTYTCPVCKKYMGAYNGFESTREPGMCDMCYKQKRAEYFDKIAEKRSKILGKSENCYDFLVIDTETTGLSSLYDEILQLSIISPAGEVLFYETFCPYFNLVYPDASRVNGFPYEKVKDFSHIFDFVPLIREILAKTKVIMGYNVDFDMGFLKEIGIDFTDYSTIDVIRLFAEYNGEYNEEKGEFRYKSLSYAAESFGYEFNAHDSKEDCLATLYVYQQLNV